MSNQKSVTGNQIKEKGLVFIVSGPSGSGKTTLIEQAVNKKEFKGGVAKVVTCTTRRRRGAEKHGRDYIFLSRAEFKRRVKRKEFLEWQKVFGEYYGTPIAGIKEKILSGRDAVICIDVKGARALTKNKDFRFVRIFILPAVRGWRAALKARLVGRLSESETEIKKRLKLAEKEIASAADYDYVVVNKDIKQAAEELISIVAKERDKKYGKCSV